MLIGNQWEQGKALIKSESKHSRTRKHIPLGFRVESWSRNPGMWGWKGGDVLEGCSDNCNCVIGTASDRRSKEKQAG